jgi:hypothetical protein
LPEQLTDSKGRPLHGRALQVAEAADRRRQAGAEQAATVRALARAVVQLLARGPLSGPDALRNLIGPDDALRVLRLAGLNADSVAGNWAAQAPQQVTTQLNGGWAGDPDHDERVIAVLRRPGASMAEISRVRAAVAAEYAERAAEKAHREDEYYGRTTMPVAVGVSTDDYGRPVQRELIHHDVPELGSDRL